MKTYTPTLTISIKDPKILEILKLVEDHSLDFSMSASLKIKIPKGKSGIAEKIMNMAKDWECR